MSKIRFMYYMGIPLVMEEFELPYDDQVLLMRIRECQRRANIGGVVHEPGNIVMADIPVDEEFSKLCCHAWK